MQLYPLPGFPPRGSVNSGSQYLESGCLKGSGYVAGYILCVSVLYQMWCVNEPVCMLNQHPYYPNLFKQFKF